MASKGGGSVMWLRVEDEDIDEAKHIRVTVSPVEEGKRKKKRKRYQCRAILHGSSKKKPVAGFKRFAWTLKADPWLCGDAQRDLNQKSLGDFRKQKRRREADNLVDSGEDDDEGGEHLCFPSPFIFMLRQCPSRRTLNPMPTPIVHCLVLLVSEFSDDRRTSKRPAKKVDTVNMGPECREPSRQIGSASSPLSSSSSSSSFSKGGNSES